MKTNAFCRLPVFTSGFRSRRKNQKYFWNVMAVFLEFFMRSFSGSDLVLRVNLLVKLKTHCVCRIADEDAFMHSPSNTRFSFSLYKCQIADSILNGQNCIGDLCAIKNQPY
jgi:hypothetical protein